MRPRSAFCTVLLLLTLGAGDARTPHLPKPWSQLSNLSDDQKAKLLEIHRGARAEIQKILARERRDSLMVLTQAQLDQLRDVEDQKTVERKLAATEPSTASP